MPLSLVAHDELDLAAHIRHELNERLRGEFRMQADDVHATHPVAVVALEYPPGKFNVKHMR